ncbi:murein biosynthesis integral membrane protein MurJ [Leucobacter luti]|uniref:Putative peptidoglycan lipid II flippase n=1 Tax=Leucobacter luti TaxID=340320 RepID=A0A4Q7TUK3_9MICO|nr:murein biosynthesis integral membrane protein MurJ [Leucobacter luti]MBL3698478.1 murein biosynthesis integral membrane protein MurJ [Leucobacter luti]RZT64433.1 putative peptidoglycan lipid II flippase [Leucobacter luti]
MATGLMRASAVMASGTMVSRILGLAKAMLLAYAIGSVGARSADAFASGNLLPNTVYMILIGGVLNAVLVPQIVRAAQNADGGAGYINKVLTLVTTALVIITGLAMAAAPWIVRVTVQDWGDSQLALATAFAYWCMPQVVFYGIYTVMGEVLNARSVFGPFTWAPVLNNVIAIAGILVFIAMFGSDPKGHLAVTAWTPVMIAILAGSATLGIVAQALILFVSWRKAGIRFRPDFAWRGVGLGRTAKLATWTLAMVVVMQLGGLVTNRIVSVGSGEGPSLSAMQNVWLIFMMPHSVIAVSLATAYFTRLSEWGQTGKMAEFRADFSASVRQVALVMVFSAVVLVAAAPFISRVINFGATTEQVDMFAEALMAYSVSLAAYSFLFVVQRAFYALSDTRTPFIFTSIQMGIVIALSLTLPWLVAPRYIGLYFALIWSFATIVEALIATWLLRRKIGSFDGRRIMQSVVKYALAAIPAVVFGLLASWAILLAFGNQNAVLAVCFAAAVAVVVGLVYALALRLLRSPELAELTGFVARKLGRTRS